ncbi:insulinase family protein [Rhodococcoides corynebacterioides]|uniref:insulinase family protein n=1 Tax=Rhodococcoides corynebacterioides TaxID=53972 RepID=UPI001C9B1C9D|nr:insulinase family protein [Rhodococcus corynebacterioides]MBY6350961.1 insulinase family protein [Rhodococcus corynebacterioides]
MSVVSAPAGRLSTTTVYGLTVVVESVRSEGRAALAVHHRAGFRREAVGEEGVAHLLEHVMFRGSAAVPRGTFHDHVLGFAGHAGGTTHQDFTEYTQRVPVGCLDDAVFAEVDRLFAAEIGDEAVAEQLPGVIAEVRHHSGHAFGGFPWPAMGRVLFADHAHAHDGWGDPADLARMDASTCRRFHERCYRPADAVLTVVGDVDLETVVGAIDRACRGHRPAPARTPRDTPRPRWRDGASVRVRVPGEGPSAFAVGYALPDPIDHLDEYLAATVLSDVLTGTRPADGTPWSAASGVFGPLEVARGDVLTVTTSGSRASAAEFRRSVDAALTAVASGAAPSSVLAAAAGVAGSRRLRERADTEARARSLGRAAVILGDPAAADRAVEIALGVRPRDVRAAAARVVAGVAGSLTVERGASAPTATDVAPAPPPVPARRRRVLRVDAAAVLDRIVAAAPSRTVVRNGAGAVTVIDPRADVVELRVRWSVAAGVHRSRIVVHDAAARAAAHLRRRLRTDADGPSAQIALDGDELVVSGSVLAADVEVWFTELAAVLDVPIGRLPAAVPRGLDPALDLCAAVARVLLLDGPEGAEIGPDTPLRAAVCGAPTILAVATDPVATDPVAPDASPWWGTGTAARVGRSIADLHGRTVDVPAATPASILEWSVVDVDGVAAGPTADPAAYAALTAIGGFHGARLHAATTVDAYAGRDTLLGAPRTFVVASGAPGSSLDAMQSDIARWHRDVSERPLDDDEIHRARCFAAGQLSSMIESPAHLADTTSRSLATGTPPETVLALPSAVAAVDPSRVRAAVPDLVAGRCAFTVRSRSRHDYTGTRDHPDHHDTGGTP